MLIIPNVWLFLSWKTSVIWVARKVTSQGRTLPFWSWQPAGLSGERITVLRLVVAGQVTRSRAYSSSISRAPVLTRAATRRRQQQQQPLIMADERVAQLERRLEDTIARLEARDHERHGQPAVKLKAPVFDGTGDLELFEQHFLEVMRTCNWEGRVAVLKLRESLCSKAQECGRANDIDDIFAALQARFGMTEKEARDKLRYLRKDTHGSLAEHASYVSRLTRRAYGDMPAAGLREIELESFLRSIGNLGLRRHLTAMRLNDIDEAVKFGNEYNNMPAASYRPELREVDVAVNSSDERMPRASSREENNPLATRLDQVEEVLERLTKAIEGLNQWRNPVRKSPKSPPTRGGGTGKRPACFLCGKERHIRPE